MTAAKKTRERRRPVIREARRLEELVADVWQGRSDAMEAAAELFVIARHGAPSDEQDYVREHFERIYQAMAKADGAADEIHRIAVSIQNGA